MLEWQCLCTFVNDLVYYNTVTSSLECYNSAFQHQKCGHRKQYGFVLSFDEQQASIFGSSLSSYLNIPTWHVSS